MKAISIDGGLAASHLFFWSLTDSLISLYEVILTNSLSFLYLIDPSESMPLVSLEYQDALGMSASQVRNPQHQQRLLSFTTACKVSVLQTPPHPTQSCLRNPNKVTQNSYALDGFQSSFLLICVKSTILIFVKLFRNNVISSSY